jgi:histidine triad (HIT) family protein
MRDDCEKGSILRQAPEHSMTVYDRNNIFARILRGEAPCTKIYEDEHVLAFNDINPKAPVHVLVIPKGEYVSIVDFTAQASAEAIAAFWRAVTRIADQLGVGGGFRVVSNHGPNGGQLVFHFHVHLTGRR